MAARRFARYAGITTGAHRSTPGAHRPARTAHGSLRAAYTAWYLNAPCAAPSWPAPFDRVAAW